MGVKGGMGAVVDGVTGVARGEQFSTHCRGHTRTGSPNTCKCLDRDLGTHPILLPPHTECGYYTCKINTGGKRGSK